MVTPKTKKKFKITKADLELIAGKENLLIEKEKRFQTELKKMRRPQVEKLTTLKETKKKPQAKPGATRKKKQLVPQ